jgi:hypothetical protein
LTIAFDAKLVNNTNTVFGPLYSFSATRDPELISTIRRVTLFLLGECHGSVETKSFLYGQIGYCMTLPGLPFLLLSSSLSRMSSIRFGVRWISKSFAGRRPFATAKPSSIFSPLDTFSSRHIGPDVHEASTMLAKLGFDSMDKFIGEAVPPKIRVSTASVDSIPALSESELHARAKELAGQNKPFKSYIGMGYHCAVVPPVILRNVRSGPRSSFFVAQCQIQVMENPEWYTPYTPYQPEIAQGWFSVSL